MQETKILSSYENLLENYGITADAAFVAFLTLIDCPQSFLRLAVVLNNTISALSSPLLNEIEQHPELKQKAIDTLNVAMKLKDLIDKCQDPSLFHAATGAEQPDGALKGTLSRNPRYTLLYAWDPKANASFQKFHQAILFLEPLIKAYSNLEFKFSDYSRVSLGFRHLLKSKTVTDALHLSNENISNIQQIHVYMEMLVGIFRKDLDLPASTLELKKIRNDDSHPSHQDLLNYDNTKYVRRVIGLIRGAPIKRRNVKNRKHQLAPAPRTKQRLKDSLLLPFTYAEPDDGHAIMLGVVESPEKPDSEIILSGEMPDEDETGTIYIIDENVPMEAYVHEFRQKIASSDTIKRLERQNNYVAPTLQQLSPREIQTLFEFINASDHSEGELALKIIILAMFFTSSPLERAMSIRFVEKVDFDREQPEGELFYDVSSNHWIIKAYQLDYSANSAEYLDTLKPKTYLRLIATKLCAVVFQRFDSQRGSRESRVIGYTLSECDELLLDTLKKLTCFNNSALARISNHMLISCCQAYGQATGTLLFNRDPLGSVARSYYTTLSTQVLLQRYKYLLECLSKILKTTHSLRQQDIKIARVMQNQPIGAKWHPKWEYLKQRIGQLKVKLKHYSNQWHEDKGWVTFHNLYTSYVILCTGLLTGLRPINTPIVVPEKVIFSAKVFVHREKSKADDFNIRYIPLCDTVMSLMQHYDIHQLCVKGRLVRLGLMPAKIPKLFFLRHSPEKDKKITLVKFSVSEYEKEISKDLVMPMNSNRRLLRGFFEDPSTLESALPTVPFEIIDAILGHANIGEQFWSPSSTLSMRAIQEFIAPYLDDVKEKLSIEPFQGMQA